MPIPHALRPRSPAAPPLPASARRGPAWPSPPCARLSPRRRPPRPPVRTHQRIPSPAYQGNVASLDGNPVPTFVLPSSDLVAKPGSSLDSWFLLSHLETARGTLNTLIHFLQLVLPGGGEGVLAVMAPVLASSTGRFVSEERRFPAGQYFLSTEACEVISPIASICGDAEALMFKGAWEGVGIAFDLTASQDGSMLANAAPGRFPSSAASPTSTPCRP